MLLDPQIFVADTSDEQLSALWLHRPPDQTHRVYRADARLRLAFVQRSLRSVSRAER
jgi:hypothetical protein